MTQDRTYSLKHFKVGCLYQSISGASTHGYEFYAQATLRGIVRVIPHTPLLCLQAMMYHNNIHAVLLVETNERLPAEVVLEDDIKVFKLFREVT